MKHLFLTVLMASSLMSFNLFAQEQTLVEMTEEEMQQQNTVYQVVCSSNEELVSNTALLDQVSGNQQMTTLRETFQAFAKSPAEVLSNTLGSFDEFVDMALQTATAQVPTEELQAAAEKYVEDNGGTLEEAKSAVLTQVASQIVQQMTGQPFPEREQVILEAAIQPCALIANIKAKIDEKGCKTPAGEALDMNLANQFCESISIPVNSLVESSQRIVAVQQEVRMTTELLTQQLQKGASAQIAPIVETMIAPQNEIIEAVTSLLAQQGPPQNEVPLAPAEESSVAVPEQN